MCLAGAFHVRWRGAYHSRFDWLEVRGTSYGQLSGTSKFNSSIKNAKGVLLKKALILIIKLVD
jgi:hypothetical protein